VDIQKKKRREREEEKIRLSLGITAKRNGNTHEKSTERWTSWSLFFIALLDVVSTPFEENCTFTQNEKAEGMTRKE
jgi:hypothetical protein